MGCWAGGDGRRASARSGDVADVLVVEAPCPRCPAQRQPQFRLRRGLFSARQPRHAEGQQDLDPWLAESV